MENIKDAISLIDAAKDEKQAVRRVMRNVHELRQFYINTLRYRLDDEFLFEDKADEFKSAEASRKSLLANEMEQLAFQCCFAQDSDLSKKENETSDLYWLLQDLASLKEAVLRNDVKMVGLYLNNIWPEKFGDSLEENHFRRAMATASGTDLSKVEQFEEHLLSAIVCRRHLKWYEREGQSQAAQLDELGLDVAKAYIETHDSYIRIPWLTDFMLVLVFDVLLTAARLHMLQPKYRFRFLVKKATARWLAGLTAFRNEIAGRAYDAREIIRRLRQYEDSYELYGVPSLVFPLLEIQAGKR